MYPVWSWGLSVEAAEADMAGGDEAVVRVPVRRGMLTWEWPCPCWIKLVTVDHMPLGATATGALEGGPVQTDFIDDMSLLAGLLGQVEQ